MNLDRDATRSPTHSTSTEAPIFSAAIDFLEQIGYGDLP